MEPLPPATPLRMVRCSCGSLYGSAQRGSLSLVMMMDVLSHFDEIQVCVAYDIDGERVTKFPCSAEVLRRCKPIYETLPGWNIDVSGVRKLEDFPATLASTSIASRN